jgi:hypothetical protein
MVLFYAAGAINGWMVKSLLAERKERREWWRTRGGGS